MNRKQAGVFAVGALVVAVAIVTAGGLFGKAGPPPTARQNVAAADEGTGSAGAGVAKAVPAAKHAAASPTAAESAAENTRNSTAGPVVADLEGAGTQPPGGALPQVRAPAGDGKPGGAATGTAGDAAARPAAPSFDLLRVEPDGSTVIAGRAPPGSKVEVIDRLSGKLLLTTGADETGSFVAVLDAPLAPGDHELVLKSVGKDDSALQSEEVATVRVPADGKGDGLLAMVSKPGEPSRIIAAPGPKPAAIKASLGTGPVASAEGSGGGPAASPAAGVGASGAAQGPAKIHVDAVEIEDDRVYVAGAAPRGSTVRVYADDKYLGESRASPEGRFVVNGKAYLAPGRHEVRADLVDPATGKVSMRASVPFDRPTGGNFAAVSPQLAGTAGGNGSTTTSGNGGPATIVQPALTNADNFVIIRRGDTLWQISRRTYGRGIRYTTIYLANSEQISNPNLILPGQVFDVPGKPQKSVDEAIQLHRELLLKEGRNR